MKNSFFSFTIIIWKPFTNYYDKNFFNFRQKIKERFSFTSIFLTFTAFVDFTNLKISLLQTSTNALSTAQPPEENWSSFLTVMTFIKEVATIEESNGPAAQWRRQSAEPEWFKTLSQGYWKFLSTLFTIIETEKSSLKIGIPIVENSRNKTF